MYKLRMRIFAGVVAVAVLVLLGRLVQLQLIRGDDLWAEAQDLLQRTITLPAERGTIYDRNGIYLAVDRPTCSLCLHYGLLTNDPNWRKQALRDLRRNEGISKERAEEIFERRLDNTWELTWRLAEANGVDVSARVAEIQERVERVRLRAGQDIAEQRQHHPVVMGLPDPVDLADTIGTEIHHGSKRHHPQADAACHIIGTVRRVDADTIRVHNLTVQQADWLTRQRHNYLPDDVRGAFGAEAMFEPQLRGRRGFRRTESTAAGPVVVDEEKSVPGGDVYLSLDISLQEEILQCFADMANGHNGSVVIVDIQTAEILAMVSVPTYDLNTYRQDYSVLVTEQVDLPLYHRAVAALRAPGSTAKPLAAIAGLTDGVITLETLFNCHGYLLSSPEEGFRCWIWRYQTGHGELNVIGAIKHSCNIFLYNVGEQLGGPRLRYWFEQFGFGEKTHTGLGAERSGKVLADRRIGSARQLAIGQGRIAVTPLHVANAMATIARRGQFLSPVIVRGGSAQVVRTVPGLPEAFEAVIEGMHQVVESPGGTAYKIFHGPFEGDAAVAPVGVDVCGKTGTAQSAPQRVDSDGDGDIDRDDRIVRQGDMAWFAGFAPRENPKIAFAVIVEYVEDGGGASVAAPIGREVLRICRSKGYLSD